MVKRRSFQFRIQVQYATRMLDRKGSDGLVPSKFTAPKKPNLDRLACQSRRRPIGAFRFLAQVMIDLFREWQMKVMHAILLWHV
ncbi:MAG: hypothetical protein JO340_09520 [Acidobacteriaceae bacterium]|nr:hypothetical protein [Acidobacteriaceae bacterium]